MLADRVRIGVNKYKEKNLINPSNTLYRNNDGKVIINGYNTTVLGGSSESAGYIVPVTPGKKYTITYTHTGDYTTTRILAYTSYPTNILNYDINSTVTSFNSGLIWTCPTNISYVVIGHYASNSGNFYDWKMVEFKGEYIDITHQFPVSSGSGTIELANGITLNTIYYKMTGKQNLLKQGSLNKGSSVVLLNEPFEKLTLEFTSNGVLNAIYQSPYFETYYPLILRVSSGVII